MRVVPELHEPTAQVLYEVGERLGLEAALLLIRLERQGEELQSRLHPRVIVDLSFSLGVQGARHSGGSVLGNHRAAHFDRLGELRYRIDFGRIHGKREYVDSEPLMRGRRPFKTQAAADEALWQIRAELMDGRNLSDVLAEFKGRPEAAERFETHLDRYLVHYRELVAQGQRSPGSLKHLERWARPGGHFEWWRGRSIRRVTLGDTEDYTTWLGNRALAPKTQRNIQRQVRALFNWIARRGDIPGFQAPPWPTIEVPDHLHKILPVETRTQVLAAIPWEKRGCFLAGAWLLMRPGELRACQLSDYDPSRKVLAVTKATKGPRLDARIGPTKAGTSTERPVWEDELEAWLGWRMEQATPEERLRGAPLFVNPTARNREKRWSDPALRAEWHRACGVVGVKISMYEGTKHTSASAMAQGGLSLLALRELGGWLSIRSVAIYAKPEATRSAIVHALKTTQRVT